MKDFNYDEAKNGAKVCTRNGEPARIVCWDMAGEYCIGALVTDVTNTEHFKRYNINGFVLSDFHSYDLQMVTKPYKPRHHNGWVALFYDKEYRKVVTSRILRSEDEAVLYDKNLLIYLKTTEIEWEV